MRFTVETFRAWEYKAITLLGMSGVGKTRLANHLPRQSWFHYSGDYRIGTRYMNEHMLDQVTRQAMQVPFLRDLLLSDSIYVCNNITVDHLKPLAAFLGKLGNPELGGLPLREFKARQALHRSSEIAAMHDVPDFVRKAREIYGYRHFVNDAGGSVCELEDAQTLELLAAHSLILYIEASAEDEAELIRRAVADPKPMYYREAFLVQQLDEYMKEQALEYVAQIDPDAFVRWVFPRLFRARTPRYRQISEQYGYTVSTAEVSRVGSEAEFLELVERAIARHSRGG